MSERKKNRTIFSMTLVPLLIVLTIEIMLLAGTLFLGGILRTLNRNSQIILARQVENRSNYLVNDMTGKWSNLSLLMEEINSQVQERLMTGELTLEDLGSASGCSQLLQEIRPGLIDTMYNKQVSGIFLIFNPGNPDGYVGETDGENALRNLQGIYLRDLDPMSAPSARHEDILVERAPVEVVRSGYLATDTGWQPAFTGADSVEQPFFDKPFRTAYEDGGRLAAKDYGYWTTTPYSLSGDNRQAIAYSVPLILEDGRVYGVLGVELQLDYLQSLLPGSELTKNGMGFYFLAYAGEGGNVLVPVVLSGDSIKPEEFGRLTFALETEAADTAADEHRRYHGAVEPLTLYSRNAPFDSDKWYLVGAAAREELFAVSRQVRANLFLSFVLTALIGLVGILTVSYKLSRPIRMLSGEVEKAKRNNSLPMLPDTGIREIDQFSRAIVELEQEVADSSTRFMQIINMASVDLAGYELREGSDTVFVTTNYFPMMGAENVDIRNLTVERFLEIKRDIKQNVQSSAAEDGSIIYAVPLEDGKIRYLRSESMQKGGRLVGLLEDVTASVLEKKEIERERDCDGLTRLYGRRGFRREADELFLRPEVLKQAALLMIDLDNLKTTNDRFGHNFGDLYIQTAGKCFLENTPDNAICARISGDEFVVLFYGYHDKEEIREHLRSLYRAVGEIAFVLPNGENMGLSASGGVAWYPEDSTDLSELMKFADFAMYQVKRSRKGQMKEFDKEAYQQKMSQTQNRLEFHQVLEEGKIHYYYQPIFSAADGDVYAYEALMRVDMPSLRSPETVLQLAKEEGRMHDIEHQTMFAASETYMALLEKGEVSDKALLFLNSIANECMTQEEEAEYHRRFAAIQDRVVVEITESEHLDMELVRKKSRTEGFLGIFALDDYGSGYNSELNLLALNPKYVKVDISIVRDIDQDHNKQHIVSNIVEYAHKRDMKIIAEGIETASELEELLALHVDLLQGYFLARPGAVPPALSEEARLMLWDRKTE